MNEIQSQQNNGLLVAGVKVTAEGLVGGVAGSAIAYLSSIGCSVEPVGVGVAVATRCAIDEVGREVLGGLQANSYTKGATDSTVDFLNRHSIVKAGGRILTSIAALRVSAAVAECFGYEVPLWSVGITLGAKHVLGALMAGPDGSKGVKRISELSEEELFIELNLAMEEVQSRLRDGRCNVADLVRVMQASGVGCKVNESTDLSRSSEIQPDATLERLESEHCEMDENVGAAS